MNRTIQEWFQDPDFKSLLGSEKERIIGRYFDDEMADDAFQKLPENERQSIRSTFIDTNIAPHRPAPPSRGVAGDVTAAVGRGALGAGEMVMRATSGASELLGVGPQEGERNRARELGQDIASYRDEKIPVSREAIKDPVRRAWTGGVESATTSLLAVAPAVTLGALTGGAGAAAAGYLMGAPMFGAAQYDQSLEEFTKKGVPKDQAHMAALMMGASETGFEFVTDALEIATVGFGGLVTKPLKDAGKQMVKRTIASTWGEAAKRWLAVAATETIGESANVGVQAEIEKSLGTGEERFWGAVKDQFGQLAVAGLIFGAIGGGLHKARSGHIKGLITDSKADPEERLGAVQEVYKEIARTDPGLAERWRTGATMAVLQGKAISEDIEEGSGGGTAAAPAGAAGEDTTAVAGRQEPAAKSQKKTAAEILTGRVAPSRRLSVAPEEEIAEDVQADKYPLVDDQGRRYRKFVSGGLIQDDEKIDPLGRGRVYPVAPDEAVSEDARSARTSSRAVETITGRVTPARMPSQEPSEMPAQASPEAVQDAQAVEDVPRGAFPEVVPETASEQPPARKQSAVETITGRTAPVRQPSQPDQIIEDQRTAEIARDEIAKEKARDELKAPAAAATKGEGERPKAEGKEPWEMTRRQYVDSVSEGRAVDDRAYQRHKNLVAMALNEGKTVPDEVLAEYPDLIEKPQTNAAQTLTGKPSAPSEAKDMADWAGKMMSRGAARIGGADYSVQQAPTGSFYYRRTKDGVRIEKGPGYPAKWTRKEAVIQAAKEARQDFERWQREQEKAEPVEGAAADQAVEAGAPTEEVAAPEKERSERTSPEFKFKYGDVVRPTAAGGLNVGFSGRVLDDYINEADGREYVNIEGAGEVPADLVELQPPPEAKKPTPLSEITVEIRAYSESGAAMTVREKADVALSENEQQLSTARKILECLNI